MSNRIVFLDIDGVLNSAAFFRRTKRPVAMSDDEMREHMLDPEAIALLNTLIERSRAKVVISSTWRRAFTLGQIGRALRKCGFEHPREIIGTTPHLPGNRGSEIDAWLGEHNGVESFVILDDDGDMEPHMGRLVRTQTHLGLSAEHVTAALALLGAR